MKEIRIDMDDPRVKDPQQITDFNKRVLAREFDGDIDAIHKHEVYEIIDDFDTKQRIYRIRKVKHFI